MEDISKYLTITPRRNAKTTRSIKKVDIQLPRIHFLSNKPIESTSVPRHKKLKFTPINLTPPKNHLIPCPTLFTNNSKTPIRLHKGKKSYFEVTFPEFS